MVGTSKKTGAAYQMRRLLVGSPVGPAVKESFRRRATGVEATELECDDQAVEQALLLSLPCFCDIDTDMRPIAGRLAPVAVGVRAVAHAKAA